MKSVAHPITAESNMANITSSEKEHAFLQLATSDLTDEQIAIQMALRKCTIDGYRESLLSKFKVQSRTCMVLEAIQRGLVKV